MDEKELFNFTLELIDALAGKLNLLQPQEERIAVVEEVMADLFEKDQFKDAAKAFSSTAAKTEFINNFLSYDIITDLLCDDAVEDIIINNLNAIYIHHNEKGFIATNKRFKNGRALDLFVRKLVVFSGRSEVKNLMNLELPNLEGRVNLALSTFGPQITITKAKVSPLSVIDLIRSQTLSHEIAAQLWIYLEGLSIRPANIMIAGGPGVGKTTLLNALFSFVPPSDRMVVIEDTLELNTFLEDSCSRLESTDEISLADLVKNSLRMRPERIVVGEVRGEEAADMITACNIGKYCMGTIHALTAREAIIRLQNEPMNIPEMLVNLIDVFIVLKRFHVDGKVFRVVDEVSETSGMEQVKILLAQLYKYDYDNRQVTRVSPSTVYRDKLAGQAALQPRDIMKEHALRTHILEVLDKKNISTIKEITTFCHAYHSNPDQACESLGIDRQAMLKKLD